MAIYYGVFGRLEKIQSAKLRNLIASLNSHTHNGGLGNRIPWTDVLGTIGPFYGYDFSDNSITYEKFANNTIKIGQIDLTSIRFDSSGYALFA